MPKVIGFDLEGPLSPMDFAFESMVLVRISRKQPTKLTLKLGKLVFLGAHYRTDIGQRGQSR